MKYAEAWEELKEGLQQFVFAHPVTSEYTWTSDKNLSEAYRRVLDFMNELEEKYE